MKWRLNFCIYIKRRGSLLCATATLYILSERIFVSLYWEDLINMKLFYSKSYDIVPMISTVRRLT
jgi:hypothetical protein